MTRDRPQNMLPAVIIAALWCISMSTGALAAKAGKAVRAAAVQTVLDCRAESDAGKRLACFDGAVAAMADAEVKGDLVTIDRDQRRQMRRQTFGLSLPALTLFDHGEKGEDADKITTTVTEASKTATGQWVIKLEGGAVWRQTDDTDLFKTPHPGSVAVIRRAALGSFFMKIDGDSAFRAHREN